MSGALTLQQVVAHALIHNPDLQVYSLEVRAREARALQQGLARNPRILMDTQDLFGSGSFKGADQSQSTVTLSQVIELGGKRAHREKTALLNRDLAQWDYETRRMDILTQVSRDYVNALAAQERLKLTRELMSLSEKTYSTVKARVDAGKVSPIHEVKAQVALASTRIKRTQARNNLTAAYRKLASRWGQIEPGFEKLTGDLYRIGPVPSFQTLKENLNRNPNLARWATEVVHRQAKLNLEQANAVPNIQLGAGGRWFQETQDNSFIFEISIPLQLFDRNQGAIAEARHRLAKVNAEKRAVAMELNRILAEAYAVLVNAHQHVITLRTQVLPGAKIAFEATREGYSLGKFGYLEALDSQRTLFNARAEYINALAKYHNARSHVERLIGESVATPPKTKKGELKP